MFFHELNFIPCFLQTRPNLLETCIILSEIYLHYYIHQIAYQPSLLLDILEVLPGVKVVLHFVFDADLLLGLSLVQPSLSFRFRQETQIQRQLKKSNIFQKHQPQLNFYCNYLDDPSRLVVVNVDGGPVRQHDHRRIAPGVDAPMNLHHGGRVRREEALAG